MQLRVQCPVCGADEAHEVDRLAVCRCVACHVEFRPPTRVAARPRSIAQMDIAGLIGELLGAAVYELLRGLVLFVRGVVLVLLGFVLIAVFAYYAFGGSDWF